MIRWPDFYVIKIALQKGVLKPSTLKKSIYVAENKKISVASLLLSQGILSKEVWQDIFTQVKDLKIWPYNREKVERENLHILERLKLKTPLSMPILKECLEKTRENYSSQKPLYLHQVLLEREIMSNKELASVIGYRPHFHLQCSQCQYRITVVDYLPWRRYPCLFCSQVLESPGKKPQASPTRLGTKEAPTNYGFKSLQEFGRYEIIRKLGRGGMGVVYKVRDPLTKTDLALKVIIPTGMREKTLKRFQREVQLASKLRHPNIVAIREVGELKGYLYFTMDYIEGEDLKKLVQREKRLKEDRALEIIKKVCSAVEYAHQQEILHRDIKPENILIDPEGEPYLLDFGLAKKANTQNTQLTQSGAVIGSPEFMSPEQASGKKDVDYRTDVYSLGSTLYYMLCGTPPFHGDEFMEVVLSVIGKEPTDLRKVNPRISTEVETVVHKCMNKEKEERYQGVKELKADIEALQAGEPIAGRRRSWKKEVTSFISRRQRALTFVAILLLVGMGVGIGLYLGQGEEKLSKEGKSDPVGEREKKSKNGKEKEKKEFSPHNRNEKEEKIYRTISTMVEGQKWKELLNLLAHSLSSHGDYSGEAVRQFEIYSVMEPESLISYCPHLLSDSEKAKLVAARKSVQEKLYQARTASQTSVYGFFRALLFQKEGSLEEGEKELTRVLNQLPSTSPDLPPFYLYYHRSRVRMAQARFKKAREDLKKCKEFDRDQHFSSSIKAMEEVINHLQAIEKALPQSSRWRKGKSTARKTIKENLLKLGNMKSKALPSLPYLLLLYKKRYFLAQIIPEVLSQIGKRGLRGFISLLYLHSSALQRRVLESLKKMGEKIQPLLPELAQFYLQSKDLTLRSEILPLFIQQGPRAIPHLKSMAKKGRGNSRYHIIQALVRLDKEGLEAIYSLIKRGEVPLAGTVLMAIRDLPSSQKEPFVKSLLNFQKKDYQILGLEIVQKLGPQASFALSKVIGILQEGSPPLQKEAALALGSIKSKKALAPLQKALGHRSEIVREAVQQALDKIQKK